MKEMDRYFEKCIEEAYKAEGRDYTATNVKWFYIVVDNQILFSVSTPYIRVTRRVVNRIKNNICKNFGLHDDGDYFLDSILQPNFVCNMLFANGKKVYLCKKENYKEMKQGEVIPSFRYEQLCKAYHNVNTEEFKINHDNLYLPYNMDWNDYRKVYFKAFGKYPEVEIRHMSKTITR